MSRKTLYVVTGPTASGKSALAIDLARKLGTEIIGADSRQIYQGIPIATAQPSPEERAEVRHHLVDILPLEAYYSASAFEEDALRICGEIFRERETAVMCGGSVMYVDALCNGIDELPTIPDPIRNQAKEELERLGPDFMLAELKRLDPEYYMIVDRKNLKRVVHAVEICRASGATYTSLRTGRKQQRPFRIVKVALDLPREELFRRINERVDRMVAAGLEEEAARHYDRRHLNSLNTVGLKEMFAAMEGKMTLPKAIERIKKNTRVYAKKQLTWLRRDPDVAWLQPPFTADRVIELGANA